MGKRIALVLVLILILPRVAAAQGNLVATTQAAGLDPALTPFVTNGTLFVLQIDPAKIDVAAIKPWILGSTKENDSGEYKAAAGFFEQYETRGRSWVEDFHRAAGRLIYGVAWLGDPDDLPCVLIVPLEHGADGTLIAKLFEGETKTPATTQPSEWEATEINGAILYGLTEQVEKMRTVKPADRPMFATGLAGLGDAAVKLVFSPSETLKMVASLELPEKLPEAAGGGNPVALVNSVTWAGLGLKLPPAAELRLEVWSDSPIGTARVWAIVDALLESFRKEPAARRFVTKLDDLIDGVKPSQDANRLWLHMDAAAIDQLIRPRLMELAALAGRIGDQQRSLANEESLAQAIVDYATDHKGGFPDSLDDLAPYAGGREALAEALVDPLNPAVHPGYVYVKPLQTMGRMVQPDEIVVVYESLEGAADETVGAAFVDGHADVMPREELSARLAAQKQAGAGPATPPF